MKFWRILFAGRKAFSRSRRGWWAGTAEVLFAASLMLAGVILIAVNITLAFIFPVERFYQPVWKLVLRLTLGLAMVVVALLRVMMTLWKVAASTERRNAIAGEIELLNEVPKRTGNWPSIPLLPKGPVRGQFLTYRMLGLKKPTFGLIASVALAIVLTTLTTIVSITGFSSLTEERPDWTAIGLVVILIPSAFWATWSFVRQVMRLSGFGPTWIELEKHPLSPGDSTKLVIRQPGRLRLKLLDVILVCEEEATFDQGTDVRTERRKVYESRLLRRRGVAISETSPFKEELEFALPQGVMHSFKSSNNRVQWKIVVHARAKGWPELEREFLILVHPAAQEQTQVA